MAQDLNSMRMELKSGLLNYYCFNGYIDDVRAVVASGVDFNTIGHNSIANAITRGHVEVAKILLAHGANPLSHELDTLETLMKDKTLKLDAISFMLENGANPEMFAKIFARMSGKEFKHNFKSPYRAVVELNKKHAALMPTLMKKYFSQSKVTPFEYMLKCPEWHKPYALAVIAKM